MAFTKTEKILTVGTAVFFATALASHFFVHLTDMQGPLWAMFLSCENALLLCLKTDEKGTIDPVLEGVASRIGQIAEPYMQHYVPFNGPLQNGTVYPPNGVAYATGTSTLQPGAAVSGNIQVAPPTSAEPAQPLA
jgi:hypothetical protein